MAINIKNEETAALVRELADALGTSMTAAVHEAVVARLEQARDEANGGEDPVLEKLRWIARDVRARLDAIGDPITSADIDELLYDDQGLPK